MKIAGPWAISLSLLALSGCGGGGGGGGGGGTTPAFRVIAIDPADGALNVPIDAAVVVTFSLPVDPATVDPADAIRVGRFSGGGETIGTVIVAPGQGNRVLRFTPSTAYASEAAHSVLVSAGLRSNAGESLGGTKTFSFRTGSGIDLPAQSDLYETGGLALGRRNHSATLLQDGRVLVAGGFVAGTQVTDRAEVFSPGTDSFTLLSARMSQPRAGHSATRLGDGRVLIAGGWYETGPGLLNAALSAEIFDPVAGTFTAVGDLGKQRVDHAALRLPDGRVFVTGGSRNVGAFLEDHDDAEVFDPATRTWSDWPHLMTHSHATHGMVDLGDGRWLLAGGSDTDLRADLFSVATGLFTPVAAASVDYGRFGAGVDTFGDGDAAVVGGENIGSVLHFDRPSATLLNTGSGTNRPRAYATATRYAPDRILVVGGLDYADGGLVLSTSDVVVQGGIAGSHTFATPMRFPTGMANHTATVLADGRVLFVGGLNPVGGQPELDRAYVFTP
jgi:hypothetical protein